MPSTEDDPIRLLYDGQWNQAGKAVEAEIAAGETDLSRLLNRSYATLIGANAPARRTGLAFGRVYEASSLAAYRLDRDWTADIVIAHASRIGADAIIETGAGWGYNLFNIWLRGGPDTPCHAFEYAAAGRETALRVRDAVAAGPALEVHAFDYRAPDLSPVVGRYRRPLVFTRHSIEQVPELPQAFIDALLDLAPVVEVLHFEPVGFQFAPLQEASAAVQAHSLVQGYNTNLWALLQANEAAGRIVIEEAQDNVMAAKLKNASSLIRWRTA
jgi:hypothetical protein